MLKRIYFWFSIICLAFLSVHNNVSANTNDRPMTLEEAHEQMGYKSVEDAVKEFKKHFKQDVELPSIKPSIPFSHQYGRFNQDKQYDVNDTLEISFLDEKSPENHYKIEIRPIINKITLNPRPNHKYYTLKNGQKALYFEDTSFNFLFYDKGNWQYIFGIDKRISNKVTSEELVRIANSIK